MNKVIFISYSQVDNISVRKIESLLLEKGFKVWIDYKNLDLQNCLYTQLEKAIKNCDFFCLISSDASTSSKWVEFEKEQANNFKKEIVVLDLKESNKLLKKGTANPWLLSKFVKKFKPRSSTNYSGRVGCPLAKR